MRPRVLAAAVGLLAASPAAALRIVAVGDEITVGSPNGISFPARLGQHLGPSATVLDRGIPGATVGDWLGTLGLGPEGLRLFLSRRWPDLGTPVLPDPRASLLTYVLAVDAPDVVLVLIGANDLRPRVPGGATTVPAAVADRIVELAARARAAAPLVLVGTLLAGPQVAADVTRAVNERLCRAEPDCVRLDQALEAGRGLAVLQDDGVPTARGMTLIARAFAKALGRRLGGRRVTSQARPIVDRRQKSRGRLEL